jgi:hypothetical protein
MKNYEVAAQEVKARLENKIELLWLVWEVQNLKRYLEVNELDPDETVIPVAEPNKAAHSFADTIENVEGSILSLLGYDVDDYDHYEALNCALEVKLVKAGPDSEFEVNVI